MWSRSGRAIVTFLNFYVSHGNRKRFFKKWREILYCFVDDLLLFPTVKEFSKSVNSWWSYCKKFDTTFLPRCMECRRGLAMRILSVRPSVARVYCDKTVERSVQIYIPYERTFSQVFWEKEWLAGGGRPLLREILGQPTPVWAKSPIFNQ